jgi:hypothetical protein
MEHSRRNQWQSLANRRAAKPGNKRNPLPCAGKEGVGGSSPPEGFAKFLLISSFCLPVRRLF